MKADGSRFLQVLRALGEARVVCLSGEDPSVLNDAARQLVVAAVGSADDPFRVYRVRAGEDGAAVGAALDAPPLGDGRPVVWAQDATDRLYDVVALALADERAALLLIECSVSGRTAKLRRAVEEARCGYAVAFSSTGSAVRRDIVRFLAEQRVMVNDEVVRQLADWAATSKRSAREAAELACLYAGPAGSLDETGGRALIGGISTGPAAGLWEVLSRPSATGLVSLDATIGAALAEGGAVGVARIGLAIMQRQRSAAAETAAPDRTTQQSSAMARSLWLIERLCKHNGVPAEAVVHAALLRMR